MNTKSGKASKGSKGMMDPSTSAVVVDAVVDVDMDIDAKSTNNAVGRTIVFPTSSPPTTYPSSSPTVPFELSECSTYDYYW